MLSNAAVTVLSIHGIAKSPYTQQT